MILLSTLYLAPYPPYSNIGIDIYTITVYIDTIPLHRERLTILYNNTYTHYGDGSKNTFVRD